MAKGKARGGAEAAAKRDEEVRRTMERLEEGVRGVFESGRYRRYLAVMSRFHSYSANNCLLIAMQRPDATLVAAACRSLSERAAIVRRASPRDDRAPRLPDRSDR